MAKAAFKVLPVPQWAPRVHHEPRGSRAVGTRQAAKLAAKAGIILTPEELAMAVQDALSLCQPWPIRVLHVASSCASVSPRQGAVKAPSSACLRGDEAVDRAVSPSPAPSPRPGDFGVGCGQGRVARAVHGWPNRTRPGMLRPWGRGQRWPSTQRGFAGSSQVLLLLPEQHPSARAHPGSAQPQPQCGAGCQGSVGFHGQGHLWLRGGGLCPAWPPWDAGVSKSCYIQH